MNTFMPAFISWLAEASGYGSLAILIVLAMAPAIRRLLGARAAHLLWLMVLLRLLVPILPALPHPWTPAPSTSGLPVSMGGGINRVTIRIEQGAMPAAAVRSTSFSWPHWLIATWAAGVAILTTLGLARIAETSRLVRRAGEISDDPRIRETLATLSAPGNLRIRETNELLSPALCGIFHPTILLPIGWAKSLSAGELHCMLAHEIGHCRRGDIAWRWAFLMARTIHWFNPLVWWAERAFRLDQEMACDAWAMQKAGVTANTEEYGEVLLKAARVSSRLPLPPLTHTAMAESHAGLGRRIRHLARFRPHGWPAIVAAGTAALVLTLLVGPARSESGNPASSPAAPLAKNPASREVNLKIETKIVEITSNGPDTLGGQIDAKKQSTILSGAEMARLMESLSHRKGVDLLSAPSVVTKSGQSATVSITREFKFPTESPSDKPDSEAQKNIVTREVGVTLEVEPSVRPNGEIALELKPKITEFEGFINYGAEISPPNPNDKEAPSATPDSSQKGKDSFLQPVFKVRSLSSNAVLKDGQTILLGGFNREDTQVISEPGKADRETTIHRAVYMFITPSVAPDAAAPPGTP
jgi:beta-lactamase regulating signal transducer with metallopeptidase domain